MFKLIIKEKLNKTKKEMRRSDIITQVTYTTVNKGKQILHLVLKQKPFTVEVIEEIEKDIEIRMGQFIQTISPKLENMNFENPEQSLKVIILRGLINVLKELIQEHKIPLTESDIKSLNEIMAKEEADINAENNNNLNQNIGNNQNNNPQINFNQFPQVNNPQNNNGNPNNIIFDENNEPKKNNNYCSNQ